MARFVAHEGCPAVPARDWDQVIVDAHIEH
jgi:hypothetical protein